MKKYIYSATDTVVMILERLFKGSLSRYIDITAPIDEYTFTTEQGTAITTLRYKGLKRIIGAEEFSVIIDTLTTKWAPYFSMGSHPIKFIYNESVDDILKRIDSAQDQARTVADRLQLDLGAIFDGRRDANAQYCHHEDVFIVLGTTSEILSESLKTEANILRNERKKSLPQMSFTQHPADTMPECLPNHKAFVETFIGDLHDIGAVIERVSVRDILSSARRLVEPNITGEDWMPRLLGDKPTMRIPDKPTNDYSSLLYPTIAEQIFPRGGDYSKSNTFEVGDTSFVSLFVDIQPRKIPVFAALFNRIHKSEPYPWSITFDLDGAGSQMLNVKTGLTAMLRFTDVGGSTNRSIVHAGKAMQSLLEREPGARFRICLATWAPKKDASYLRHRVEMLINAVQGWGECEVKEETSDSAQGLVSILPGVGFSNIGTTAYPPLRDAIRMLPLTRPASLWDQGGILYRTFDGKIWPYQPASSFQESCIDVFIANPRQGKTVLAYLRILAYILSPRNARIPFVTIMDVGDPGEGFVGLLHDSLPKHQHHNVNYKKLTDRDTINVLTPLLLGSRFPSSYERETQINFILQLTHTDPTATPDDDLPGLTREAINFAFSELSDDKRPNQYRARIVPNVDDAIKEESIVVDGKTSWWEVVDALFDAGRYAEAHVAQCYAAPLLTNLVSALNNSESIKHLYKEDTIKTFQRKLIEASTAFPQLSKPTNMNLTSRIQAFNLENVAPEGGSYSAYRTSVMYLAVSHISSGRWFFDSEDLKSIDRRYTGYHLERLDDLRSCLKYLYFDEVHRTEGAIPVQRQMARYCSEKPKLGVSLGFSSQLFRHFNEDILKNATNIHILNSSRPSVVEDAKKYWDLTPTEVEVLKSRITGKSKLGSTIFYIFESSEGLHKQALRFSPSPQELWSLSSTQVDKNLRTSLFGKVGRNKAIALLSKAFPAGSAAMLIERRTKETKSDETTVIKRLVNELMDTEGNIYV